MNSKVFDKPKPIIGVLQLLPLPGSIGWNGRIDQVIARAEQEATALATGGVDGILVENTFDAPYAAERMDMAGAIAMGLIIRRIMHFTHLPIGINVLRNDPETALAIAMNVGAKFIRVNLLTGVGISDAGLLEGKYRDLLAYKHSLQVEDIAIYADVSLDRMVPKMSHLEHSDQLSLKSLALQALEPGGADGIILKDTHLSPQEIQQVSQGIDAPVFYEFNQLIADSSLYLEAADGLVVSQTLKKSPVTTQDLRPTMDLTKVEELTTAADLVRGRLSRPV